MKTYSVFESFSLSFSALFDAKILIRILLPFILIGLFCLVLLFTSWETGTLWIEEIIGQLSWLHQGLLKLQEWLDLAVIGFIAGLVFLFLAGIFFYFVILMLASLILVPVLLPVIEEKYFPELKNRTSIPTEQISITRSILNSFKYAFIYLFWFILTLPLFWIPGTQILISFFLNSYLVKSLFPMDVLMDYVSTDQYAEIKNKYNSNFWQLSFLNNSLLFVPVLNFIAPVIMVLSFGIYGLGIVCKENKL